MAPTRPYLPPLRTPKNMTFPSELRDSINTSLDSPKSVEMNSKPTEEAETAITPPSAYTDFLNTFSPIFGSPKSSRANFSKYMLDQPHASPTSAQPSTVEFSRGHNRSNSTGNNTLKHAATMPLPSTRCIKGPRSPDQARRPRLPPSQGHLYTPVTAPPLSAHPHLYPQHRPSPSEWRFQQLHSPATEGGSFCVRQVVTTTVTFRMAPRLAAPPAGKKKKAAARRNT
ncbi:hypothetical protein BJY04DRAFT_179418 [Aspergillus karnatakaensis]|uniref:uncharacterized protein n=1 Tax=Aspergillus karnatakaensis TaxID=1810916 RepID=UPI003CCD5E44